MPLKQRNQAKHILFNYCITQNIFTLIHFLRTKPKYIQTF